MRGGSSSISDSRLRPGTILRSRKRRTGSLPGFVVLFGDLDQFLNRRVQFLVAGRTDVLVADDALVVDHVECRPAMDIPLRGDRSTRPLRSVPEGAPGDLL